MAENSDNDSKGDVVFVHGVTEDGAGLRALRQRKGAVEHCDIRTMEQGKPIHGEVVSLKQRAESPMLFDVAVEHEAPAMPAGSSAATSALPVASESPQLEQGSQVGQGPPRATPQSDEPGFAARSHSGPARVGNPRFRSGWDRIWGDTTSDSDLPN